MAGTGTAAVIRSTVVAFVRVLLMASSVLLRASSIAEDSRKVAAGMATGTEVGSQAFGQRVAAKEGTCTALGSTGLASRC